MTIEEYEKQEAAAKLQRWKKIKLWLMIGIPFLLIATCNIYINTHQQNAIMENPEPGDYFVFKGLIGKLDQPFKLKAINNDTMEFFIPKYEFISFKINKTESKVYDLERKGELYDSTYTLKISKETVDDLQKNSEWGALIDGNKVYLKAVFGRARGNAVSNTIKKLVGNNRK
jgi:hypothetical protein